MRAKAKQATRNLAPRAWRAGFRGVTGLAAHLGIHRVTVYRAVSNPHQHGPTFRRIQEALDSHGKGN
jgi:DNA-binding phage protein